MTKRNILEDNVGEREEHTYAAPRDGHQVDHPGADQRTGEELNRFRDKFQEKLEEAGSERSAAIFNGERSIADFETGDRKEIIQDWINGFNAIQFADNKERRETALEVTASVFKPIYRKAELEEFRSQIDPVAFRALQSQGVEEVKFRNNGLQPTEITIEIPSKEKARNILQKSGGRAYAVEAEKIHAYEWNFSQALFHSDKDPEISARSMNQILDAAIAYAAGTNEEPIRHEVEPSVEAPKQEFGEDFEALKIQAKNSPPYLDHMKETWSLALSGSQPANEPTEMDRNEREGLWHRMIDDPELRNKVEHLIEDSTGELDYNPNPRRLAEMAADNPSMWNIIKHLYHQAKREHPVMGIESLPGHEWTNQVKLMKYIRGNEAFQSEIEVLMTQEQEEEIRRKN